MKLGFIQIYRLQIYSLGGGAKRYSSALDRFHSTGSTIEVDIILLFDYNFKIIISKLPPSPSLNLLLFRDH